MFSKYDRLTWRGFRFNRRTVRMLKWAERRSGVPIRIAQGSFNKGGVAASAGTHDGSSVDIKVIHLSKSQRVALIHALKDAGFAAWVRKPPVFGWHIHAIPTGDAQVSSAAAVQVRSYDRHRDGLAGDRHDPTYRPSPKMGFSFLRNRPVRRK